MFCETFWAHVTDKYLTFFNFRNLAYNRFPHLPSNGLKHLIILQTAHNEHLHEIPAPKEMPSIEKVVTAYPYHCCEYIGSLVRGGEPMVNSGLKEDHIWLQGSEKTWFEFPSIFNTGNFFIGL